MVSDCIIIGAGQAGLVAGLRLKERSLNVLILERDQRVGDVWRRRPDSMRLFTSRRFCQLPGLDLPGEPDGYPDKNEIADYLERFAIHHQLPVKVASEVVEVTRNSDLFNITLADGKLLQSKTIINATGANQQPVIPKYADQLNASIYQLTAANYLNHQQIPAGLHVGVVGDGASGRQIAMELHPYCKVTLFGKSRVLMPNRLLGKDLFWWLHGSQLLYASGDSFLGRKLKQRNPAPCKELNNKALQKQGIQLAARVVGASNHELQTADGKAHKVDVVIWCIGYQENTDWLKLPHCIDRQGFITNTGTTPEPGMFVVGRKWLSCRASELLLGADRDASRVAAKVAELV